MSTTPMLNTPTLNTIDEAIAAIAAGKMVVVVDDTDRENEGDLIMAASAATTENMAFMIRHTSGIICAPMTADRADRLHLPPMVANNQDPLRTAFTISVDYKVGMSTGIAAEERTNTVRALANDKCVGSDFLRPGHVFPLISRSGGVLTRSGHTEAGTDLATLAGLPAVGVLAEIVNDDGTVKRLPELLVFAKEHDLKIISIEDLIAYRVRTEQAVTRVAKEQKTIGGLDATIYAYASALDPMQHAVVVFGSVRDGRDVPVRIHREQTVNDTFSRVGTRGSWLDHAVDAIRTEGRGVVILLRSTGIEDLAPIILDKADDSLPSDAEKHDSARQRMRRWREVGVGAQILRDLGIKSIALLASHKHTYVGLGGFGIEITRTVQLPG